MKILHLEPDSYPLEARRLLEAVGGVTNHSCHEQEEFLRLLGEADYEAVFLRLGLSLNREALEAAPHLHIVATPTTGLAHLDIDGMARRGIVLLSLGETALLREITSTPRRLRPGDHSWSLDKMAEELRDFLAVYVQSTSSAMGLQPGSTRRRQARGRPAPSAPLWTSSKAAG